MQLVRNKKVYIIILNWNGWKDTIECLESIFRLDYENYRVVICDNNSSDGSLEYIKAWADGRLCSYVPQDNPLRHLSFPPRPKPIPYQLFDRNDAETCVSDSNCPLIIIQTGANLGFAGGNNVGLRFALNRNDFEYAWLLNNDTSVRCDTLCQMVATMASNQLVGICGSTILHYRHPEVIQVAGGVNYNKWFGTGRKLGASKKIDGPININAIESQMDYVEGASMLVSINFLKRVGLISEEYFLYFEEIDWAMRARGLCSLAYAPGSFVYHKEGASIGSSCNPLEKSIVSEFYFMSSRLLFSKKFFPLSLLTIYLVMVIAIFNRIRRHQWDRVLLILKLLVKHRIWPVVLAL